MKDGREKRQGSWNRSHNGWAGNHGAGRSHDSAIRWLFKHLGLFVFGAIQAFEFGIVPGVFEFNWTGLAYSFGAGRRFWR